MIHSEIEKFTRQHGGRLRIFLGGLFFYIGLGSAWAGSATAVDASKAYQEGRFRDAITLATPLATKQKDATAQNILCLIYAYGKGVAKDANRAETFCEGVAQQGMMDGQMLLAIMYQSGENRPVDYPRAAMWFRKAAEGGNAIAQYALGSLSYEGRGVSKDYVEAARWWQRAARQGNPKAFLGLGQLYSRGLGVDKNYVEAYKWWTLASSHGYKSAQVSLFGLKNLMTSQQVQQGLEEAKGWSAELEKPRSRDLAAPISDMTNPEQSIIASIRGHGAMLSQGLIRSPAAITLDEFDFINNLAKDKRFQSVVYLNKYGEIRWSRDARDITLSFDNFSKKNPFPTKAVETAFTSKTTLSIPVPGQQLRELCIPIIGGADNLGLIDLLVQTTAPQDRSDQKKTYPALRVESAQGGNLPRVNPAAAQHYLVGIIHYQQGYLEQAAAQWTACLKSDPGHSDCRKGLARIKDAR